MLAMAAVLFTACTQEDDFRGNGNGDEVTVAFSVEMPTAATRAYTPGECIDELVCVVFEKGEERYRDTIAGKDIFTFTPQLINGRTYDIVFWAQNTGAYDVTNATAIKRNAGNFTEAEYDAFTYVVKNFQVTEENLAGNNVKLGRPFAQLNIGVTDNDLEKVIELGYTPENVVLTVDNAATEFNALTGKQVNADNTVSYTLPVPGEKITVAGVDYNLLSQCFVLLEEGWPNANVTYEIKTADEVITSGTINNVPFDANYKTNIVGTLMTEKPSFNITINAAFATTDKAVVVAENVAAANAAFAAGETNVKINEITEDAALILPNTENPVTIVLPATDKEVKVNYSNVPGAATPETVDVKIPEGEVQNVVVNAPESTVNIEGEVENITVYSADNTAYIKAGAKVGTVTVGKGNVVIEAGAEVTKVVRAEGNEDEYTTVALAEGVEAPELGEDVYLLDSKIGDVAYPFLKAFDFVKDGETITLTRNVTFTETNRTNNSGWWDGLGYSGDKSFTIDLGGFTVSQKNGALNDYLIWLKNDGAKANTIILKNGTLDAGTTAYCALATASSNAQKITVNLENIQLINNNSNGATLKIRGGAELNAKDGTIITGMNSYGGIEAVGSKTVVNIYEGAKIYQNGKSSNWGCLAGASGNSTINVYGGEGTSAKGGFMAMTSGGTINISGGEWTANTNGTIANDNNGVLIAQSDKQYNAGAGNAVVNVTGGTFKGGYNCYGNKAGDAQINISGGNFNADPTKYLAEDAFATEVNGVYTVELAAAKVGGVYYRTLEEAFKAVNAENNVVEINKDITINYNWDNRKTGSKFAVPVTINGNDKTIKFTASVNENNYQAPFRFEADAIVNDLTVDMSETTDNRFRAISSKGNLTVAGCKFIGKDAKLNARGVIFGEGAGENVGNLAISITDCEFINWRRGITDNENGKDVKSVTVTGNTLTNAAVYVSAYESVTFTGNTVEGAYVDIRSYTAGNALNVTATGNTLTANTDEAYNQIKAGGTVNAQDDFKVLAAAKIGNNYYGSFSDAVKAAREGDKIVLLEDDELLFPNRNPYEPAKNVFASEIDLNKKTLTIKEGDIRFNNTTIKNGNIIVEPGLKGGTAIFLMYSKNLTFDAVKITATGNEVTYLIDLEGTSNLNLLNGSEILVDNTTAIDTDIICSNNGATENNIVIENSKVTVNNIDGRVFFSGNYTVKDSEISLAGISKAGFRINANQTLSIEGTSKVYIEGELRDGGIHLVDAETSQYYKADTAKVEINKK